MTIYSRQPWAGLVPLIALTFLSGCKEQVPESAAPVEVGVMNVDVSSVDVKSELTGRTTPFLLSQVRARVDGIVIKRAFIEGQEVQAGQLLYQIDPAPYKAALNSAEASLARAKANIVAQSAQVRRYDALVSMNAVSRQEFDNAVAAEGQAQAEVRTAESAVEIARINLGYTSVVSPIKGRIGISAVTPGAYVRASEATLLTTIQQTDPMYVDLTQSSADGLRLRTEFLEGRLESAKGKVPAVKLLLENGQPYSETGALQFSDISVDQGTGSVTVRAVFPNKGRLLLPGMFVRAQLTEGVNTAAMLVPQSAVSHDQSGRPTVLTVDAENKITHTPVTTAGTQGQNWVVTSGLRAGDKLVVQGRSKVKPGNTVKVVMADMKEVLASGADAGRSAQ